jgi:hypothetical protein
LEVLYINRGVFGEIKVVCIEIKLDNKRDENKGDEDKGGVGEKERR